MRENSICIIDRKENLLQGVDGLIKNCYQFKKIKNGRKTFYMIFSEPYRKVFVYCKLIAYIEQCYQLKCLTR